MIPSQHRNAIQMQINASTTSLSQVNEEEMIKIDIGELDTYDTLDPLDKLLFTPNTSLHLQQQDTITIKKYFQDRQKNGNDEYNEGYINFYKLHVLLRNILINTPNAENQFIKTLDKEWIKYQKYAQWTALKISDFSVSKNAMISILKFNEFTWINQQNLNHLILKHDAISAESNQLGTIWDWKLKYNPQNMLFPLIKKISNLYNDNRSHNKHPKLNAINSQKFERENIKYWVRQGNIFQVIGIIIQHLPIYIYQSTNNPKTEQKSNETESVYQKISSVYFDNDDFKCYHERIQKEEGARSIRVRWYGEDTPKQSDIVYFERKIHHQKSVCDIPSEKERFKLKSNEMISFVNNGRVGGNSSRNNLKLQNEVYSMIQTFGLTPKTRTVYNRIAFQFNHSNSLRVSLDLNLKFIRETNNLLNNSEWFTQFSNICDNDVAEYPLCVLEIKLGADYVNNPPKWIQDLMDSQLLMECYKFSKYGESVNQFYQNKITVIPKWRIIEQENNKNNHETKMETNNNDNNNKSQHGNQDIIENIVTTSQHNCGCCHLPFDCFNKTDSSNWKSSRKKKAVNPKVYFSNERTFLGWFQAAVFIGGSGLTIHSINADDIAGYLLISVAGLVLLWAVFTYYKRNMKLLKGSLDGLHDFYGPAILVSVIIFVFAYSLMFGNSNVNNNIVP